MWSANSEPPEKSGSFPRPGVDSVVWRTAKWSAPANLGEPRPPCSPRRRTVGSQTVLESALRGADVVGVKVFFGYPRRLLSRDPVACAERLAARMVRVSVLGVIVTAVALAQAAAGAQADSNLTGTWKGVGGAAGTYEIAQTGTSVKWYGHSDDGHTWAHDFSGSITGDEIVGTFQDRRGFD